MLNLPKFLFINGPVGSGKSTLAKLICNSQPRVWRESFAEPIRQMIYTVFFPEEGPVDFEINLRDGPTKAKILHDLARLEGKAPKISVRLAMIDFSEHYMKPKFGQDVFGQLCYKRCQAQETWYDHFVIDDSGFTAEAQYVIDKAGAANCVLIHLRRAGLNFTGDSRGYIELHGTRTIDLDNDGAPMEMIDQLQLEFGNL